MSNLFNKIFTEWKIVETELRSFEGIDFNRFTEKYRGEQPTLLVYRLQKLPWTGIIRVSPKDQALCAVADSYPSFFRATYDFFTEIVDDSEIYKLFCTELKDSGLKPKSAPLELFGNYVQWGEYGGKISSFGIDSPFMGLHRLDSVLFPNEFFEDLISYHQDQLYQFRNFAFIEAPEGSDYVSYEDGNAWNAPIFSHLLKMKFLTQDDYFEALTALKAELTEVIGSIKSGRFEGFNYHYKHIVRPPLQFNLITEIDDFAEEYISLEIFQLRLELIQLLGWPQFYIPLLGQYEDILNFHEEKNHCDNDLFNSLVSNLGEVIKDIENKYPIVKLSPIRM